VPEINEADYTNERFYPTLPDLFGFIFMLLAFSSILVLFCYCCMKKHEEHVNDRIQVASSYDSFSEAETNNGVKYAQSVLLFSTFTVLICSFFGKMKEKSYDNMIFKVYLTVLILMQGLYTLHLITVKNQQNLPFFDSATSCFTTILLLFPNQWSIWLILPASIFSFLKIRKE